MNLTKKKNWREKEERNDYKFLIISPVCSSLHSSSVESFTFSMSTWSNSESSGFGQINLFRLDITALMTLISFFSLSHVIWRGSCKYGTFTAIDGDRVWLVLISLRTTSTSCLVSSFNAERGFWMNDLRRSTSVLEYESIYFLAFSLHSSTFDGAWAQMNVSTLKQLF